MSLRRHLTFANAMSLVAVFIALTAGAYAAGLGRNSVKSKQIKDGAVATQDLADAAVTGPKVLDVSIGSARLADGAVSGAKVADGSLSGADIGDDSLSGADIAEASLQGITATSADTISGLQLKKINFQSPINNGVVRNLVTFPNVFRIDAQCANNGDGLDIAAFTAADNSKISMVANFATSGTDEDGVVRHLSSFENLDFDASQGFAIDNHLPQGSLRHQVTIQFATPNGFVATVQLSIDENAGCVVTGNAIGG
jgi:hypothetical protein